MTGSISDLASALGSLLPLGESLLVIGRQVVIEEVTDRIDLLALVRQGE